VQREQLGPNGVDGLIKLTADLDGPQCAQREEREGGASGIAVTSARAKTLKGHDYAEVVVTGSKITRSRPFRAQCEAGNVFLVRGPWNQAYIDELCGFPTGKNDDQVDGSSTAFNAVLLEPVPEEEFATW
jgi:predicted phage terminase large subunit-like protein